MNVSPVTILVVAVFMVAYSAVVLYMASPCNECLSVSDLSAQLRRHELRFDADEQIRRLASNCGDNSSGRTKIDLVAAGREDGEQLTSAAPSKSRGKEVLKSDGDSRSVNIHTLHIAWIEKYKSSSFELRKP